MVLPQGMGQSPKPSSSSGMGCPGASPTSQPGTGPTPAGAGWRSFAQAGRASSWKKRGRLAAFAGFGSLSWANRSSCAQALGPRNSPPGSVAPAGWPSQVAAWEPSPQNSFSCRSFCFASPRFWPEKGSSGRPLPRGWRERKQPKLPPRPFLGELVWASDYAIGPGLAISWPLEVKGGSCDPAPSTPGAAERIIPLRAAVPVFAPQLPCC